MNTKNRLRLPALLILHVSASCGTNATMTNTAEIQPTLRAKSTAAGPHGSAIEMAIASRIWEMSIHVYERASSGSAGSTPSGFRLISAFDAAGMTEAPVVRVLYSGRCHYDALSTG